MNIQLKFTNLESTEAIESYVESKFRMLEKLLTHLDEGDTTELHIELAHTTRHHQKGNVYAVKAKMHIPGKDLLVEEEGEDLYATVDVAKDTLHRSLEKYKELKIDERDK